MRTSVSHFLSALFIAFVFPVLAQAQQRDLTPEQLALRAAVVAEGRVTVLQSGWNPARTRISTQVTIAVSHYLKGAGTEQSLTLTVPGGEVDGEGETYSHVARFRTDEQVVVFADRDGRGGYRVTGGEQGKMTIHEDPTTRTRMVSEGLSLDILKARIRNAVNATDQR